MNPSPNRGGRPKGAKNRPPSVPGPIARQSLRAICDRAKAGDEKAQALVVWYDGMLMETRTRGYLVKHGDLYPTPPQDG